MGQRTQPHLKHLFQVIDTPAPPEVMERRRRALLEFADTLRPPAPLWTVLGVPYPSTEAAFMNFLRVLGERSGLSYAEIASRTAANPAIETVPRSTVHGVLRRDTLPKREDQLRALLVVLLEANHATGADLEGLINLRAQLLATRTKAGPPVAVEPVDEPVTCTRCQRSLARVVGLLSVAFATGVLTTVAAVYFVF